MNRKALINVPQAILVLIFSCAIVTAQENEEVPPEPLPLGFTSLELGTELSELKLRLSEHPQFDYRGDPDISFTPVDQSPLIESKGRGLIERGIFQFKDNRLYSIILHINQEQLDYFTFYRYFDTKYGESTYLDPNMSYWESELVRVTLEKPLIVKYLDLQVFEEIKEDGRARESITEFAREIFLNSF